MITLSDIQSLNSFTYQVVSQRLRNNVPVAIWDKGRNEVVEVGLEEYIERALGR